MIENEKGNLLIIDDDAVLARTLGLSMQRRGYNVKTANSVEDGIREANAMKPDFAVIDLKLNDGSGLNAVEKIRELEPECKIVMLTAYGNFTTAVAAIKRGAVDYLAKPADADMIEKALQHKNEDTLPPPPEDPMPPEMVKWEHIQRVYEQCERNVTQTAKILNMHRRSLQRILKKHAPHDAREE